VVTALHDASGYDGMTAISSPDPQGRVGTLLIRFRSTEALSDWDDSPVRHSLIEGDQFSATAKRPFCYHVLYAPSQVAGSFRCFCSRRRRRRGQEQRFIAVETYACRAWTHRENNQARPKVQTRTGWHFERAIQEKENRPLSSGWQLTANS
jgi:hypothetical protein